MTPSGRPDDRELVEAARGGDADAFETLVRTHIDAVYAHGLRFFGEPSTADDVVQEVFIKVFKSLDTYDGRAAFTTWLFRVTRNVCLDLLRRGAHRPVPVDPIDLVGVRTEPDHAQRVVDTAAVEQAMRALQPEDREALGAVSVFGLSYQEAAETLDVPVGTVKSRVFRARRTLVQILRDQGGDAA